MGTGKQRRFLMDLRSSHDYNTFGPGISLSFFAYHFEGFIQRMPGLSKVENERRHGVCLSGSGPKGCYTHPMSPDHHNHQKRL